MKTWLVATAVAFSAVLGSRSGAAQTPAPPPTGEALYGQNCRACHGTSGVPSQRMLAIYKALAPLDSAFLAGRSEDSLVAVVRNGIGPMKGYKDRLTPEQIVAIAKYVRTLPSRATPP
jgi:mono/diheme cytochrome c family protein